jgi:Tubulin-tyrosine ligase family
VVVVMLSSAWGEANLFILNFAAGCLLQGTGYDRESGMKWPIQRLRIFLQSMYGIKATIKLFHEVQEIVIKSLLAVQQAVIQDKHCFELYGYDVLVDEDLTPWLIEVLP